MRYCDLTLAYTPTSGGIRTYIDAKRKYLDENLPDDEHVLIVPGPDTGIYRDGRLSVYTLASPIIPGCAPYRFFWHPKPLQDILEEVRPDVIELGSFFICPFAAFKHRKKRLEDGEQCFVSAYFHTDIASAYFGAPLKHVLHEEVDEWSHSLAHFGFNVAEAIENGAVNHFGGIFEQCDMLMAATDVQRTRLFEYGVDRAEVVPLGVDLELFHPNKRSDSLRKQFRADDDTVIIVYAGRLDPEKHPDVLLEAFSKLSLPNARLILSGEGSLRTAFENEAERNEDVFVVQYLKDRQSFAELLASSDIYATAGPHETFGLSVVEAQASGLPVVGVDAGALPERVVEGTGLLGPTDDAETMARNIETIAGQLPTMKEASRQHVVDLGMGWDTTFSTLFSLYRNRVN